jgi:enterochelin esterase family protein
MMRAIQQLERDTAVDPAAIDRFLEEHRFPLSEGRTTTFVFRGAADEVHLRHWIYGLPSTQPFERIGDTDLWWLVFELPERSRVEYKLEIVDNGERSLILDPLNPLRAHDPYGANSVCQTVGYETPEWTHADTEARPGKLVNLRIDSAALGEERLVRVYVPPRLRSTRRYPLLIVHDGDDFVRYANLPAILDNLIYRLEIPRLFVALTQSPDRIREYAVDERHDRFLADELLPRLESEFPLLRDPSARGLMGASLGAVACVSAARAEPERFGRLLLLSGSFAFSDLGLRHHRGPVFDPIVKFMNEYRDDPRPFTDRLFVSCGTYESLIYENRSLVPILQSTRMDVRYVEARDGHNWENWRDRLREALAWLFPGPLWMVYE